jgi:hypothetical protein
MNMHIAVGVGRLDDPELCAGDRNSSLHECRASQRMAPAIALIYILVDVD